MNEPAKTRSVDLEQFFYAAKDLFCIAGFDGYFKQVNPAVIETLGYTEDELFSRPINSFIYHEDQVVTEQRRNDLRQAKILSNFENRYVTKGGELVWLSWTSVPDPDQGLVFAVAKNITPKKTAETELEKSLVALNQSQLELKELVYTALHDLRSPVSNMISIFQICDELNTPAQPYQESLGMLKNTVAELKNKMDYFLDRIVENKGKEMPIDRIAFENSLTRVLQTLTGQIAEANAVIRYDFSPCRTVCFDETYLDSIFMNLISNSIKYAVPGKAPVIEINNIVQGDYVQLTFKDNGLGFDMEALNGRIFQAQQRFHNNIDGKGLGLYLVKSHLVNSGGDIKLVSRPGEGAIFTLYFKN